MLATSVHLFYLWFASEICYSRAFGSLNDDGAGTGRR